MTVFTGKYRGKNRVPSNPPPPTLLERNFMINVLKTMFSVVGNWRKCDLLRDTLI